MATRQDITPKTMQGDTNRLVNHAESILDLPISDIRRKDHLKPLIDLPLQNKSLEQAKRVAGLLSRIFQYAVDCGYIDSSPDERLSSLLPRQMGEKNHHAAQTTEGSCRTLFSKIWEYAEAKQSGPFVTGAMKIACYVPLRCSNLRGAKWEDVDLEEGIWHFPRTKNGRSYDLPISRQVKEILSHLRKYSNEDIPFCFPGTTKSGHISDGSLIKYLRNSGITKEEQSLHGFRSTFQSIALEHGIPKVLTERILFHVAGGATEQAYNRTTYLGPTKAVMQWWADAVDAMRDGKQLPDIPEIVRLGGAYQ
uniref:tyrosine-type recombinase/integrase n=1 Tax=Desulfovibrio sp. An276 TaxID=1965618 RepID=UPI0013A6396D|nr:site-specific integrase [Desulfovibrio sp. An276]